MRLFVVVQGDEIIVTSEKGFGAARCTDTDDHDSSMAGSKREGTLVGVDNMRGALPDPTAGTPDPIAARALALAACEARARSSAWVMGGPLSFFDRNS
jgi:hypothetical protein